LAALFWYNPGVKLLLFLSLLLVSLGCGSGSKKDVNGAHPHVEPSPDHPMVCNLDLSTPLPLVSLSATPEEVNRLRARYASFVIEMGPPVKGGVFSLRFDKKGGLGNPWNFYLRNYAPPYPVRLIGILPDGVKEVVHEELFQ
jgi:hypothetical protein